MARSSSGIFLALVALVLAAAAAGWSLEARAQPAAVGKVRGPAAEIDTLLGLWDAAGLRAFASSLGQDGYATLALAAAALLEGQYAGAAKGASHAAQTDDEQLRARSEALAETATAWEQVFARLVVTEASGPLTLRVPADLAEWGTEVYEPTAALVKGYLDYFSMPEGTDVSVVFLNDLDQLAAIARVPVSRLEKSGTMATTMLGHIFLVSPASRTNGYRWDVVLCHETVHLVLQHKAPGALPHYLEEGIASFLETVQVSGSINNVRPLEAGLLQFALEGDVFLDWKTLNRPFWELADRLQVRLAFLQSRLAAAELAQRGGQLAVARFVEAIAGGATWEEALEQVAGISPERLASSAKWRWRNSAAKEYLQHFMLGDGRSFLSDRGQRVLERAGRTVLLGDLLWGRGEGAAALTVYLRLPPELQDTPELVWRITRLLADSDDVDEAVKRVDDALLLYPDDAKVLYAAAHLLTGKHSAALGEARQEQGRRLARRAWLVNPFANETVQMLDRVSTKESP